MFDGFNRLAVSAAKVANTVIKTYTSYGLKSYSTPVRIPMAVVLTFANNKDFSKDIEQVFVNSLEAGKDALTSAKFLYKYLVNAYDEYYLTSIVTNNNTKENFDRIDGNYKLIIHKNNTENIIGYCNDELVAEC